MCIMAIDDCFNGKLFGKIKNEIEYINFVKKIRNDFVHNEWQQVKNNDQNFSLSKVISTISKILSEIELLFIAHS